MAYECPTCNKFFTQSKSLAYHIKCKACLKDYKCPWCNKPSKTKASLRSHKSQFCKMNPKRRPAGIIEDELVVNNNVQDESREHQIISREDLFNIILMMKQQQEEMQQKQEQMEAQIKNLSKVNNTKVKNSNVNNGSVNNGIVNNSVVNNNQINNNQTINIVGFGKEDMTKLNKNEVFRCLRSGFCYPSEMTIYVNFNKDFPENHNIQLNNVRDNGIKYYDGEDWNTIQYDEFYDNIVERQMTYVSEIKENKDIVYEKLPPAAKVVLDKIEDLETLDPDKYKKIKQKLRNKIIDKRSVVAPTQKMLKS